MHILDILVFGLVTKINYGHCILCKKYIQNTYGSEQHEKEKGKFDLVWREPHYHFDDCQFYLVYVL